MFEESTHYLRTPTGNIPYVLLRSSRRKTIELSVPASVAARVVAPRFVSLEAIERFIHSRSDWINKHLQKKRSEEAILGSKKYENGHEFLYLGQAYPLIVVREDRLLTKISFSGTQWKVLAHPVASEKTIKAKLIAWYRREAGEVLGSRVFYFSRIMGLVSAGQAPAKITVKSQKSLWGSCNHHGKSINLNWTLIMAPLAVIDYVVVHELCHLDVPNHSAKFWRKVARYQPDYKSSEEWLKGNGVLMRLP